VVLFSGDGAGVADPMMRERRETGREREGERGCVCWWKKKENERVKEGQGRREKKKNEWSWSFSLGFAIL
jgi:hypothetical protein